MENPKSEIRNPKIARSICLFCSLGCGVCFRKEGERVVQIDYDTENPVNNGSLCPRGHYNLELIEHPQRLGYPLIGNKRAEWEEALSMLRSKLKDAEPSTVGILISGMASNEEALLAGKLARTLGITNISCAGDASDAETYGGARFETPVCSLGKVGEIDRGDAVMVIGDILNRSPVLSQRINKVKYGKRGNKVIVIDPDRSHTSWFATSHLKLKPGSEAALLAGMIKVISEDNGKGAIDIDLGKVAEMTGIPAAAIAAAARDFNCAASGFAIMSPSRSRSRNDLVKYLVRLICDLSPNKKQAAFYCFGNALGVNVVLDRAVEARRSFAEIRDGIINGEITRLAMFGDNPFAGDPDIEKKLERMELLAFSSVFPQKIYQNGQITLPLASHLESGGTFKLADGRIESVEPVTVKAGRRSNFDIIASLLNLGDEDGEKLKAEALELAEKGPVMQKASPAEKIAEALEVEINETVPAENITHFGNNDLVRNFFWFRANNRSET
ncbi:MAG TPA: molybdopterin-dependent oxidoreductase [Candidatus Omnitrophota bacterium]|nr:molybdopterin-dependent oxidoreductase [Candidatus Omnitrophota bacterium]